LNQDSKNIADSFESAMLIIRWLVFYGLAVGVTVAVPGRKSNFGGGGGTIWNPFLSVNVKYVT
jgi:hypothetical protein